MIRRQLRAMGTDVELLLDASPSPTALGALARAAREFHRLEALLSRFRPDSELSRLNRAGRLDAGPDLLEVVELALAARAETRGRFDPTVHDALVAAGYDRSFERVAPDGAASTAVAACGGGVRVDGATIELEPGYRLDLGGIGKGFAVDRALALLPAEAPALVNAGGDLACCGTWPVGVEDGPTLQLADGAIATSGRDRRRWRRDGEERHHLIDPATGRPAETDLARITVVARTAVEAEVLAKALFLGGADEARAAGVPCAFVHADGTTELAGGLA